MGVERLVEHERLGDLGVAMRARRQSARQGVGVGDERVGPQGELGRLVVSGHERPGLVGAQRLPPQAGDPLGVRVLDGRVLRCVIGEGSEQRIVDPG